MSRLKEFLAEIIDSTLHPHRARELAGYLLTEADDLDRAAVLAALRARGEAPGEVAGFSMALLSMATRVEAPGRVLDTAGTGGDGSSTLNVSTAAALVAASLGATVAKHGNRSISGRSGSADFMKAIGYNIDHGPRTAECMLRKVGFTFLYAPNYHKLMAAVAPVRRRLGVRTIFNLAGPLSNPARPRYQVLGVADRRLLDVMAEAGSMLGYERLLVVHGYPGIDEVSISGPTLVAEPGGRRYVISPEDLGVEECSVEELRVEGPGESAARALEAMKGGGRRCDRLFIAANAGLATYTYGLAGSPKAGVSMALEAMESGRTVEYLGRVVEASRECTG